jgi:PBP1b-binding outer membrane lipoprotein LpoB
VINMNKSKIAWSSLLMVSILVFNGCSEAMKDNQEWKKNLKIIFCIRNSKVL